jgi:hypothetical protein
VQGAAPLGEGSTRATHPPAANASRGVRSLRTLSSFFGTRVSLTSVRSASLEGEDSEDETSSFASSHPSFRDDGQTPVRAHRSARALLAVRAARCPGARADAHGAVCASRPAAGQAAADVRRGGHNTASASYSGAEGRLGADRPTLFADSHGSPTRSPRQRCLRAAQAVDEARKRLFVGSCTLSVPRGRASRRTPGPHLVRTGCWAGRYSLPDAA